MNEYSDDFLDSLEHHPLSYHDLLFNVIDRDVRRIDAGIADLWLEMVLRWRDQGLSEDQCVDLFYFVVAGQYTKIQSERLMDEITAYLGEFDG